MTLLCRSRHMYTYFDYIWHDTSLDHPAKTSSNLYFLISYDYHIYTHTSFWPVMHKIQKYPRITLPRPFRWLRNFSRQYQELKKKKKKKKGTNGSKRCPAFLTGDVQNVHHWRPNTISKRQATEMQCGSFYFNTP